MFSARQRRNGRRTRSKRLLHSATGVADPQQRPAGQTDRDKQRARAAVQQRASLARRREQQGGGRVLRPEWAGSRRARMGLVPAINTSPRHGRATGTECCQPRQPSVRWNDSGHNRSRCARRRVQGDSAGLRGAPHRSRAQQPRITEDSIRRRSTGWPARPVEPEARYRRGRTATPNSPAAPYAKSRPSR